MSEIVLRNKVVTIAKSWLNYGEVGGKHKTIIDTYNRITPLPVGYKVKYTDEWCATFVSAVGWKAGLSDIILPECSCIRMVELYKKKKRWQESDSYVPSPGDIIMYDWGDTGKGDNTGNPDHVGIVASVNGDTVQVIEGNKSETVGYRYLKINGRYIRGYCLPDYASKVKTTVQTEMVSVSLPVLKRGSTGAAVTNLQVLLTAKGCNTGGIDGSFGPNTDTAFRKFQKAAGLTVDGSCGQKSWNSLLMA